MDLDLPGLLRRVRRDADLSQRELARMAGVTRKVVAALESGAVSDPHVGTVQRLLRAAGCSLAAVGTDGDVVQPAEDGPLDGAGRRYPAHLDVRPVHDLYDWWAWREFQSWSNPPLPKHTFDMSRVRRDRRRAAGGVDPDQVLLPRRRRRPEWKARVERLALELRRRREERERPHDRD